jgi:ABC-type multidrug transport system fused ATPase/permease subunit
MKLRELKVYRLGTLLNQAFGRYKRKILLMSVLNFFSGFLDSVGVSVIIPLFALATNNEAGSDNMIVKMIKTLFELLHISFYPKYLLILICVLFLMRGLVALWVNYISLKITFDYEEKKRAELFDLFIHSDWGMLLRQKLGHLETMLITNVRFGNLMLSQLGGIATIVAGLVIYVFIALNLSYYVTSATLVLGFLLFYFFKPLFQNTKIISHDIEEVNKEIAHFVSENTLGMKTIKIMDVGDAVLAKGKGYFNSLSKLGVRVNLIKSVGGIIMQPLGVIFVSVIFAFLYKTDKNFSIGVMAVLVYLIQRMMTYFQQLQSGIHVLSEGAPYLQALINLENEARQNVEIDNGKASFIFNQAIEFKNIHFSYDQERSHEVLSNVNFTINKGETIGLVGSSGAGKTTIVDLILRLFKPTSGEILLDGKNIDQISLADWRKNCGYVSQDIHLINDTIANNIRFYNDSICDAEIMAAAKAANIFDFIDNCPEKFATKIGERGVMLSVGQRQRIVIARILARKTNFLIFDEATSALDSESEAQIQAVINSLKKKMTIFIIAHRLSTVINCDQVIALKDGKTLEQGSPKELLNNPSTYFYKAYNQN